MQTSLLDTLQSTTDEVYKTVRTVARETPLLSSPVLDELAARSRGFELGDRVGVVCSGGNISPAQFTTLLAKHSHH